MANKIQLRRDTAEAWIEADPVLSQGEPGVETDTGRLKIGNGESNWTELDYVGSVQLPPDAQGYLVNDGDGNLSWGPGDGTFSGDYNDLTNAPTIPTDVNQLTDENGLLGGGGGNVDLGAVGEHILPTTDITYDIGSPTKRFRDLYLSSNTLYLGDKSLSITDNKLEVGGFIFGEAGNVTGVAITQYENNIVSIRVSTGSDGDTIANSIVKGDKLKLNSPVNGLSVLTVVSTSGQVVVGYNEYTDYTITVAENKGSGLDNIEFNLIKPIFGGNYNDLTDAPTIPTDVSDLTDTTGLLGVGGASTGNIRFDNTWIKNVDTGNIYISPQDSFTYLDLPSDTQASAGSKVTLTNEAATGGVRIRAGQQGKNWDFNYDGSITFPDNKISQVSDSNLGIQTSKSLTTDNIIANGSEFNTDQNVDGFGVINGWSQRNAQQIEMNLFVAPAPIWVLLTGLALGRTVIVTYSTGSGNQTFTGVLSQLFTATGQYDQFSRQRYSGRIDGTIPANQTGIVSINFPELSTQTNNWQFSDDGVLTLPANGDIVDSNGNSVLGGGGGIENDLIVSQNEETFINFNGNTGRAGNLVIGTNADQDVAISVYEGPGNTEKHWIFGSDGDLVLPEGKTIRNTDGDDLLAGSGGSTLLPPYKGFRAHYGTMYNNTDDNNGPINKIVIYRDSVSPSSAIDTDTSSDDFQVTGLTGSDIVAMLVVISDGSNWDEPTLTTKLKTFAEAIVDNVILDEGVEGDFNNINAIRTAFYDNFSNFNSIIGDEKTDFEFFENDYNVSAQTQTGGTGTGSGFIISNLQKQGNTIELSGWSNGSGYQVGDVFTILGTNITDNINNNPLASPDNDVTVTITGVDVNGVVESTSISGTLPDTWPTYSIDDGGNDEYDGANAIHTNLETDINYNDGAPITNSTAFGGGDYVVTYQEGIFGIFATGANINIIGTSGNSGGYGNDNNSSGFDSDGVAVTGSLYGNAAPVESPTQITNTDGTDTYSVSVGTDGVVTMTTARGILEVGALPEPGGPTHLHVMKAAGSNPDLYFGDDFNYVLQRGSAYGGAPAYGVEIGTNDNNGGDQQVWRFGTNGSLTLPNGGILSETPSAETVTLDQLTDISGWTGTLVFTKQNATTYQALPDGPLMSLIGSNWVIQYDATGWFSSTDLMTWVAGPWAGTNPPVGTLSAATTTLTVNSNDWKFGDDGVLTIPDGGIVGGPVGTNKIDLSWDVSIISGKSIRINSGSGGVVSNKFWTFSEDTLILPAGSLISDEPIGERLTLSGAGLTAVNQTYTKTSATLYTGGNGVTIEAIGGGVWFCIQGGDTKYSSTDNLITWDNSTGGLPVPTSTLSAATTTLTVDNKEWKFDEDGKLTLPAGGDILNSSGQSVLQGIQGVQGIAGGSQGIQGIQGFDGNQGVQGITGNQGIQGVGFTYKGTYVSGDFYTTNDVVVYEGSTYIATAQSYQPPVTPPNAGYWDLLAAQGAQGTSSASGGGSQGIQGITGPQGPGIYESDTPPFDTDLLWYDTVNGRLYLYYDSSWVDASPKGGGSQGVQGITGNQGVQGITGNQGVQGTAIQGTQGVQGSDGQNGDGFVWRGPWEAIPTSYIGGVDVVSYLGSNYIKLGDGNSGSAPPDDTSRWQLYTSRGEQGVQGTTGNQGVQGTTGNQGVQGTTGNQGVQGTRAAEDRLVNGVKEAVLGADGNLAAPSGGNITVSGGGKFIGDGSQLTNLTVNQASNIIGSEPNVTLVAGSYSYLFDNTGTLTLPENGDITMPGANANLTAGGTVFATKFASYTGSWTLAAGANTVSLTVPINGTYSIWVRGNIPSGIVSYTATVVVTNTNVPVLGSSYGWYYVDGNQLVLTAIPTQIIGTANNISTATVSTTTANVFTFGITNNSGSSKTVDYGYTRLG